MTYQSIFKVIDIPVTSWYMTRVATAAMFVGVLAPSGGLSGAAYLLADARSNGRSTGRTAVGGVLIRLAGICRHPIRPHIWSG